MSIAAAPLSRLKIRKLAKIIRETCGMENTTYFPVVQFIEWILGNPDNEDFNFEIVEPEEMEDMYGNTNTWTNVMKIRRDVYEGARNGNPRDRFTLCHELGHYFLHRPEVMSYARGDVPKYQNPEWQANTFAGELMASYDLIKNMSIEGIMEECGMSRQAAMIQYNLCRVTKY